MSYFSQSICKSMKKGKPPLHDGGIWSVYSFYLPLSPSIGVPSIAAGSTSDPNLDIYLIVTPSNFVE